VLPGEPDARAIAREALETYRLRGLKLHCHVQRVAPDDPRLDEIYRVCAELGRPVLIHAGREPASPAYGIDVRQICSAQAIRRVLERHPDLTLVVPHLGADEVADYGQLLAEFPNLWLDTTMMLADYFPLPPTRAFVERWGDRLLYGSDFPNLPYAWDRELRALGNLDLPDAVRQTIVRDNARRLFDRL